MARGASGPYLLIADRAAKELGGPAIYLVAMCLAFFETNIALDQAQSWLAPDGEVLRIR